MRTIMPSVVSLDGLFQGEPMILGVFNNPFHVAAAHEFSDNSGLAVFFAQVEDGDYVGVGA